MVFCLVDILSWSGVCWLTTGWTQSHLSIFSAFPLILNHIWIQPDPPADSCRQIYRRSEFLVWCAGNQTSRPQLWKLCFHLTAQLHFNAYLCAFIFWSSKWNCKSLFQSPHVFVLFLCLCSGVDRFYSAWEEQNTCLVLLSLKLWNIVKSVQKETFNWQTEFMTTDQFM